MPQLNALRTAQWPPPVQQVASKLGAEECRTEACLQLDRHGHVLMKSAGARDVEVWCVRGAERGEGE